MNLYAGARCESTQWNRMQLPGLPWQRERKTDLRTSNPTPPPKGTGKIAIIAGVIVALIVVVSFVGMNLQHAQDQRDQQAGKIKPSELPAHEKDLGKAPVQPK
jgi:hypothetical protein